MRRFFRRAATRPPELTMPQLRGALGRATRSFPTASTTMVTVTYAPTSAIFEVEGIDKLWALRSRLEIPLAHVVTARVDPTVARGWWHGLRLGGTNMPGVLTAGTFYHEGGLVFWDVHDPERTVVVELTHEHYRALIIEVEHPQEVVDELLRRLAGSRS